MTNLIEVHKYLVNVRNDRRMEANFNEMIEWVTTNVGPALSLVPTIGQMVKGQFGCFGDGWGLQLHNLDHPEIYSRYLWYMEIENEAYAVAFKILWP